MTEALLDTFILLEGIQIDAFDRSLGETLADGELDQEEDVSYQPASASSLTNPEIYFEMEKRGLKTTGFPDTDRDVLQRAFDREFEEEKEVIQERRAEARLRALQQRGLALRRELMEQALKEERVALSENSVAKLAVERIQSGSIPASLRLQLNSPCCRALGKALCSDRSLVYLNLANNQLDNRAVSYLGRALATGESALKHLNLASNALTSEGCAVLCSALLSNRSLQTLDLSENRLCLTSYPSSSSGGSEEGSLSSEATGSQDRSLSGLEAMARLVEGNSTLTAYLLNTCGIPSEGMALLLDHLEGSGHVLTFSISGNLFPLSHTQLLAELLERNRRAVENGKRARMAEEKERKLVESKEEGKEREEREREERKAWLTDQWLEREQASRKKVEEDYWESKGREDLAKEKAKAKRIADRKAEIEAEIKKKKKQEKKKK